MENTTRTSKSKTVAIIALALLATGAIGTTAYINNQQGTLEQTLRGALADKDKALAEQHAALEKLRVSAELLASSEQKSQEAENRTAELEGKLRTAEERAHALVQNGIRNEKQAKELADLKLTAQQLRDQLNAANESSMDLRASADRANADRDKLKHDLDMKEAGAALVNNSQVDALKGKKAKLTVKARRTNELHMAFDLPEAMAKAANFKITSPKGNEYSGASPSVSTSRAMNEATASANAAGKPGKASTARVDLKFNPKKKLEPGVYQIEVLTGQDHLQTFFLHLR